MNDLQIPLTRTLDLLERGVVLEEMVRLTDDELDIIKDYDLTYDPDECMWVMTDGRMIDPARLTGLRAERDYSGAEWLVEMRGAY